MENAGWPRRIGALFVDWFVALLTVSLISGTRIADPDGPASWWALVAFFVEASLLTALLGRSFGKRLFGIRVANRDGGPIGARGAIIRTALLCLVIPALLITDRQRGLHDVAAGSIVVRDK